MAICIMHSIAFSISAINIDIHACVHAMPCYDCLLMLCYLIVKIGTEAEDLIEPEKQKVQNGRFHLFSEQEITADLILNL